MRHSGVIATLVIVLYWGVNLTAWGQARVVHTFTNVPDGANPQRLTWTNGLIYGSTAGGGTNGYGSIFTWNTNGAVFQTIFSFADDAVTGANPNNLLVTANAIYGTTQSGGTNNYGTVFAMSTNGTGCVQLYGFGANASDGTQPLGGLVLGGNTLYGTTHGGGTGPAGLRQQGTIFKINTDGSGYAILHSFTNSPDGAQPQGELVLAGNTLYGTTTYGGNHTNNFNTGYGTVYAINTDGSGYTLLHSFTNVPEPFYIYGGLALTGGQLYGVGELGGTNDTGAIFALSTNGGGFHVCYSFSPLAGSTNADGREPQALPTVSGSYLYGATITAGPAGGGTLFLINTNGAGFAMLCDFTNNSASGYYPVASGIRVGNSVWGTTSEGNGSNALGTLYSLRLPALLRQPQSLTVTNANPASFAVAAADDAAVSYQWYFNTNTLLIGQQTNTLTLASATNNNAGAYTVVIADAFQSVTSRAAWLTVVAPPVITQPPQNCTVLVSNTASFTNLATGTAPLAYQWYFNTNNLLAGQTNSILVLSPVMTNQAGYYTAVVTNLYGSATSTPALLTVNAGIMPVITQPPQNDIVTNGYGANFTNVATGTAPLAFQWYFNTNTAVPAGTNGILTIPFATTNQAGYYTVIVTNLIGAATSAPALLTVVATKPIIFTQPQPLTVTNGDAFSFTVVAAGQNPLRYQWYTNKVATTNLIASQTNSLLALTNASVSLARNYLVVITNMLGKATSNPALLTVVTKPVMTLNPQNTVATNGEPVTFQAAATGAGALRYQWFFQTNTLLASATNTWLTFTNAITNLAGHYSVRVTNTFGAVTSSYALLTISNQLNFLSFSFNPASGSPAFAVANVPHSTNWLWATTNLAAANAWRLLATNIMATNGLWFYTDTNAAQSNALRFYRFSTP